MAGGSELLELVRALLEKEEMERKERRWPLGERGVDNLATPPTAEQRGDAARRPRTTSGDVGLHYRDCAAQGEGRVRV